MQYTSSKDERSRSLMNPGILYYIVFEYLYSASHITERFSLHRGM